MKNKQFAATADMFRDLFMTIAALIFLFACAMVDLAKETIAQATINRQHWRLLRQLHELGLSSVVYDNFGPTESIEELKDNYRVTLERAEEYRRLRAECEASHVPKWRVRWITACPFLSP